MKKTAFTLAEVLITLAIIGVVAAITIPSLMNKINNDQYVQQLKKTYSELSQATNLILNENGGDFTGQCEDDGEECLRDLYKSKMIGVRTCVIGVDEACWHKPSNWYYLSGAAVNATDAGHAVLIENSGTYLSFNQYSKNCSSSSDGIVNADGCGRVRVDLNGMKPPNTIGRDIFDFHILKNKIVPRGTSSSPSTCPNWGCTAKVLTEGAMNY